MRTIEYRMVLPFTVKEFRRGLLLQYLDTMERIYSSEDVGADGLILLNRTATTHVLHGPGVVVDRIWIMDRYLPAFFRFLFGNLIIREHNVSFPGYTNSAYRLDGWNEFLVHVETLVLEDDDGHIENVFGHDEAMQRNRKVRYLDLSRGPNETKSSGGRFDQEMRHVFDFDPSTHTFTDKSGTSRGPFSAGWVIGVKERGGSYCCVYRSVSVKCPGLFGGFIKNKIYSYFELGFMNYHLKMVYDGTRVCASTVAMLQQMEESVVQHQIERSRAFLAGQGESRHPIINNEDLSVDQSSTLTSTIQSDEEEAGEENFAETFDSFATHTQ
ncbi:hypothetical protein PCE1_002422 [Barthelona sp. PCE]